jgi:antitoxin component of MazEF toxin-antitoxin module
MKVFKWAIGLGVQLPKEIILELGLHEGDEITLSISTDTGGVSV